MVSLLVLALGSCNRTQPTETSCADDTCSPPHDDVFDAGPPPVSCDFIDEPFSCDIEVIRLRLDVSANRGEADYVLSPFCTGRVSLVVNGLTDVKIERAAWHGQCFDRPLKSRFVGGRLDIATCCDRVTVTWKFKRHVAFNGLSEKGSSVLWPEYCSNLFPCHPSMESGARYTMAVTGVPKGQVAVYPAKIDADAPAYMPALAIGDYTYVKLGSTKHGTEVGYWALPSTAEATKSGLSQLTGMFEWLETTLGKYPYGDKVGGVAVDWGLQYGGVENHPYWHVSKLAMGDVTIHVHEAAHGWFGSGVRLQCWNDLVMSEGTADYLTAAAVEAVQGKEAAAKLWNAYESLYNNKVAAGADMVVWPDACGDVKSANTLVKQLLYKKGALFWRAVAAKVGTAKLHAAMADYIKVNANKAGTLAELIEQVEFATGVSLKELVTKWLKTKK